MATMHEIDYEIIGEDLQFVKIELDPGEAAVAEAGNMMYIEDDIQMDTVFGDGSPGQKGFMGALMGAHEALLAGRAVPEHGVHLDVVFDVHHVAGFGDCRLAGIELDLHELQVFTDD